MNDLEIRLFRQPLSELALKLSYYRRLERLWLWILNNYDDPEPTLEIAARASGVSKNHLNVLLSRTVGLTFHELLTRYRLLKAIEMMGAKDYSVTEVAEASGFGSCWSFERNFRRVMGCSPQDLRRKQRQPTD
jgi:AraC-like DNA-binding protein